LDCMLGTSRDNTCMLCRDPQQKQMAKQTNTILIADRRALIAG